MKIILAFIDVIKKIVAAIYLVVSIVTFTFLNTQPEIKEPEESEMPIDYNPPVMYIEHGREGTKGRLYFERNGYSVALYESFGNDAQIYVDAYDSAAWFMWDGSQSPIIADHCNQGFDILGECEIGDMCYIVDGNDYQRFECILVDFNGQNTGEDLLFSTGESFRKGTDPGYLYMYTCSQVGNWHHIIVTVWVPIYEYYEDEIPIIDEEEIIIIDDF